MHNLISWTKTSSITRYALIGASAFLIDFCLLKLGLQLGLHLLVANGISVITAIVYSFFMHRHFTFAYSAKAQGYSMHTYHQFAIFVSVSIGAFLLSEGLVNYLVVHSGFDPGIAKILSSAVLFVWNYGFNRLLTFRTH